MLWLVEGEPTMQVKIGPSFFKNEWREYSDPMWGYSREAEQNCFDCNSRNVAFTVSLDASGNTVVAFENDGDPMSRETLVDKLLALGESGKADSNSVGFFGKAKILIYMLHESYKIHSGGLLVQGRGGDYDLTETQYNLHGTRSTVTIKGDVASDLCGNIRLLASMTSWSGSLSLNGEKLDTGFRRGRTRRDLGWARVSSNKSFANRLVVRIGGIPMFKRWITYPGCLVVDLAGSSGSCLQANRDGLRWEFAQKLDAFITEITVDKSKALRNVEPQYQLFTGKKFTTLSKADEEERAVLAAYATAPEVSEDDSSVAVKDRAVGYDDSDTWQRGLNDTTTARSACGHEFLIKNTTGLKVPEHYLPGSFSAYSLRLVELWRKCLLELHAIFGKGDTFSIGFLFDAENAAECESTSKFGKVLYINPAVIVSQKESQSRSLKRRWNFTSAGKYAIMAIALHEYVHADGYNGHNEEYSSQLTTLQGVLMARMKNVHKAIA